MATLLDMGRYVRKGECLHEVLPKNLFLLLYIIVQVPNHQSAADVVAVKAYERFFAAFLVLYLTVSYRYKGGYNSCSLVELKNFASHVL